MLEKIPDSSPTPYKASAAKTVADLAAVRFAPSRLLYLAQLCVYMAMLIFSLVALLPFFLAAWYWLGMWLIFAWSLALACKSARRRLKAPPKHLQVTGQQWRLNTAKGEFAVTAGGELLLWPWLIIIPLRELLSGRVHYLVALPDSLEPTSWRRLSTWLNLCFARV